jgi:Protein of unknown function (DUF1566)
MRGQRNIKLTVLIFWVIAFALILPGISGAGNLEPSGPPGSTMKTLDHITPTWSQKLPTVERFIPVLDGAAVLDKETGLVWQKSLSTSKFRWYEAVVHCYNLELGGRFGCRLPTVEELQSLADPAQENPALPNGHPFENVQSDAYWTAGTSVYTELSAWFVNMYYGTSYFDAKDHDNYVWCVRGGHGDDTY